MDAFALELGCDAAEIDPGGSSVPPSVRWSAGRVCLQRGLDLAVVGECAKGVLGHRVHDIRSDQLRDVKHVGVIGVLRCGARPQRALALGAQIREPLPLRTGELLQVPPIGNARGGECCPTAQRRALRQALVDLRVDP